MATSADIESRLDYLRDTYGSFPVESGRYQHSSPEFEAVKAHHERGCPGAVRVWVERGDETLLVRTNGGLDGWGVAGGLVEPDERTDTAAEREVREETNIECRIVDVAYAHIAENRHEETATETDLIEELAVAFIAEYVDGDIDIQETELQTAKWWHTVPENSYPPASRLGPERL